MHGRGGASVNLRRRRCVVGGRRGCQGFQRKGTHVAEHRDADGLGLGTWLVDAGRWWESVRAALGPGVVVERGVLAVADDRGVPTSGVLAGRGLSGSALQRWMQSGGREAMLDSAGAHGECTGKIKSRGAFPWGGSSYAAWATLPTAHAGRAGTVTTRWVLGVARKDKPFSEPQSRRVALLLRELAGTFESPCRRNGVGGDAGLCRAVLSDTGGVLVSDLGTASVLVSDADAVSRWWSSAEPVVRQRWKRVKDERGYDVAIDGGGESGGVWLRIGWRKGAAGLPSARVLECRPRGALEMPVIGVVSDARVAEALGQLCDRVRRPPTLVELAEHAGMSPFHFLRVFQEQAGVTPKQFALRAQLMRACWLLRATGWSVGEVGEYAGFGSHGHFTATFSRLIGQSPSDYRERFG